MDTVKIDLSFIIPCHNLEDYICLLLDSFLRLNTHGLNVEYIFVLDNCTDNTQDKIKKRMQNLSYKIIHCDVKDPGLARNIGIENSKGEFIWFIDGDDWLLQENFLFQLITYMRENNCNLVKIRFYSNATYLIDQNLGTVWQYIFSRELIGDIRFGEVDERGGGEDGRFGKAILQKGGYTYSNIPYLNDNFYYYYNYYRYGSIMSTVLNIYNS